MSIGPLGRSAKGSAASLAETFWNLLKKDYLQELQKRPVNSRNKFEVIVGDLVLVHESNLPTLNWLRGRVTKLMHGKDGIVRNVMVKKENGEKARDVRYLSFLPFEKAECVPVIGTFKNKIKLKNK